MARTGGRRPIRGTAGVEVRRRAEEERRRRMEERRAGERRTDRTERTDRTQPGPRGPMVPEDMVHRPTRRRRPEGPSGPVGEEREEMGVERKIVDGAIALMDEQETAEGIGIRAVGKYVFDHFFGGDAERVSSTNPKKKKSYAKLVERMPDETATWNKDKLRRAVCAEIVARGLARGIVADRVKATYLWRLYFVDDLDARNRLARDLAAGVLKGNAAWAAIAKETVKESHGGRAPKPEGLRVLNRVRRILVLARNKRAFVMGALEGKAEDEVRAAIAELRELIDEAEAGLD